MSDALASTSRRSEDAATQTQTIVISTTSEEQEQSPQVVHLLLQQPPKSESKVKWSTDTVDNEFMDKKKSKCCCIYTKPKVFGEQDSSSSDSEDEGCTEHCRGHKKKCYQHKSQSHQPTCQDGQCDIGAGPGSGSQDVKPSQESAE